MRRLVWIIRAEPGASETARRVVALGREPLVAPLLTLRMLRQTVDLTGVAALAFTSANAVFAFTALTPERRFAAYAVGARTAEAAAAAGFGIAAVGEGGVDDLAALIIAQPAAGRGRILHPSAREPAGDLVGALTTAGIAAERVAVYAAEPVTALPPSAAERLSSGEIETVLTHSPRASRTLAGLAAAAPVSQRLAAVRVLALSPACLAPLASLALAERIAARQPSETALLALL